MQDPNGERQVVRAPRLGTLQTAVMDPGLARHFGFATQFDDLPDLDGGAAGTPWPSSACWRWIPASTFAEVWT